MIIYNESHDFFGLKILSRIHGSAAYKSFVPSLVSSGFLLLIHFFLEEPNSNGNERWFGHPYPLSSMVVAFTFLLTFKCSFSYNRYWEACTAIHVMHAKWLDVGMEMGAFHLQSQRFNGIQPPSFGSHPHIWEIKRTRERENKMTPTQFREKVDSSLRGIKKINKNPKNEDEHYNFDEISEDAQSPKNQFQNDLIPLPHGLLHGVPSTPKRRKKLKKTESCITLMQAKIPDDPSLFLQEATHLISLLSAVAFSTLRGDVEGVDIPLRTYNPGDPWPAVDPDDDADARSKKYDFYHTPKIFRVFQFLFGSTRSQQQQTFYNACREFGVLGGVSDKESDMLKSARGPLAKTALCTFWLREFMNREYLHGAMGEVAAPIVSRLFQYTSDGMNGYNQARKVAYVPFPFPHTQLTSLYIVVMMICIPILMLSFVKDIAIAAVLNCLTVTVFVGLHEVAKELEDPFRNAPNDLPLNNFQAQFNEALITMYAGYHPESWWVVDDTEAQRTR